MARTLFHGGEVLTLASRQDEAGGLEEALVIEDGRVLAAGDLSAMSDLVGADDARVDLAGAVVMPGLVDSHPHMLHFAALGLGCANLFNARNHDDIITRIKAHADLVPPPGWVLATPVGEPHYFIRRSWRDLAEGALPDRHVLDKAVADRPVMLQGWAPTTPNYAVLNSAALAAAGLTAASPDQIGAVTIYKDDDGTPTGLVEGPVNNYYTDDPFWSKVMAAAGPPPDWLWEMGAQAGMGYYNALGVTAAYEAHAMMPEHIAAYQKIRNGGAPTVRVMASLELANLAFDPFNLPSDEQIRAELVRGLELTELADPMLRINGISFSRGGPCEPGYIRMHMPYKGPDGRMTRGKTFLPGHLDEMVLRFCAEHKMRCNYVLGGDRDGTDFLAAIDALGLGREFDCVLQHVMIANDAQSRRYGELGYPVTSSPGFAWGEGDLYRERIGAHVLRDFVPIKRLMDHGLTVAFGSDWGPDNPFEQMQLGQTHQFCGSGDCNPHPGHCVSRREALDAYTGAGARVMGWRDVGTLAPGAYADIAIVDRNPLTCPLDDLADTKVHATVLGGNTVHDTGVMGG